MNCRTNSDVFFLSDEKFDFDVPMSPDCSKSEEDDEVFAGPIDYTERRAAANLESQIEEGGDGMRPSWSPLSSDQLEAVCQEALRLATQLQSGELSQLHSDDDGTATTMPNKEFIQDTETKLAVFCQPAFTLSPIKRQTFCVQDSPMKQLPPAIQHRLLKGRGANTASSTHPSATNVPSSTRPGARLSTSSPVAGAKAPPRAVLRGKAALGVGVVLPSKPAVLASSISASKSKVEKTRLQPLQPLSKDVGSWKRSPASRLSSRAESYEDLLSDSTSVASDISDSSLNSSLMGKRTLAPPTKSVVRNVSGVKALSLQNRRVTDRKNTSSSSSSVSSFNSSLSLSPAKGKLNSSLNRSVSGSTGPTPSRVSKPASHSRPRCSTVYGAIEPTSSTTSRRSLSVQARKLSEPEHAKAARSTSLKRAEATPLQPTPTKRVLDRAANIPTVTAVQPQTGLKARPKPEAVVLPILSGVGRGVQQGDDVSKMLKPKRLMSAKRKDSLPQKPAAGPLTPSAGDVRLLQVKMRRPSALPTPVRHKACAVPSPGNQARLAKLLPTSDPYPDPSSASPRREGSSSSTPIDTQEVEPVDIPGIQPFCLEVEEMTLPAAPPSSAPQPDQSESTDSGATSEDQSEPSRNLIELESAEEITSKTQEVLLLDLPAPTLQPQEKLLIDLTNTPNLIRTSSKTHPTTQLIDLSSPLIKWSPEDKKENTLLINLSF
uniref:G2 and S phase-expressed protein 1 N-terminal domain-containing protein n=1 Tax=Monopterus albus TaxID=43700 RepID=A0A3Q3JWS9_MONAL|nr:G2 and S phase-expressed protein 1 [Monopterus albus]XP_020448980.1 G2 and S phase-expressed protein 1 [Monopterus albus]